jgi:hypothetical protein
MRLVAFGNKLLIGFSIPLTDRGGSMALTGDPRQLIVMVQSCVNRFCEPSGCGWRVTEDGVLLDVHRLWMHLTLP